jgi:hypothetical protein
MTLLVFYLLSVCLTSAHAKSLTLNFTNPAVLYSSHWTVASYAGNTPFAASAQVGSFLSVNFPENTVSAEFVGFKQRDGSAYGVCLDCDTDTGSLTIIDGHDRNNTQPVVLFSAVDLSPNTSHALTVFNLPDNRFAKRSKITFHSIILDIDDSSNSGVVNGSVGHEVSSQPNNAGSHVSGDNGSRMSDRNPTFPYSAHSPFRKRFSTPNSGCHCDNRTAVALSNLHRSHNDKGRTAQYNFY